MPVRPLGVVAFIEEEGARFGVACLGSRLLTGVITPDAARALTDAGGVSLADGDGGGRARPAGDRPGSRAGSRASPRTSSCTSSRAARSTGWAPRWGSPSRSGRTAGGGWTSPAGPTTRAPPGWPTAATRCCRTPRPCSPPGGGGRPRVRWPRSARSSPSRAAPTRSARRSTPGWTRGPRTRAALNRLVSQVIGGRAGRRRPSMACRSSIRRESFTPVVDFDRDLRDRAGRRTGRTGASPRRCCRPEPGMTPGCSRPGCRPRCCSSVTRPGCRTRRPSMPSQPTARPGVAALGSCPARNWPMRRAWPGAWRGPRGRSAGAGCAPAWHAELAWLPGVGVLPDVLIEAAGDRFTAITPRIGVGALPPGTSRLTGLTLPGLANAHSHAFHRALRGVTQADRGYVLDLARADVPGRGARSIRTATWRWPAPSTPRWRWPGSAAWASSTTCITAPGGERYADPNADEPGAARRGGAGGHPDHAA